MMSSVAMVREKRAGYWNIVKELPLLSFPRTENNAPIIGPNMNPREKATPTRAWISCNFINKYFAMTMGMLTAIASF